jgi:catechol 2,3-dioxygenase-like lactoylglutathione lyase family enzyme
MNLPDQRVVPALRVMDYAQSKAFYTNCLGFTVELEHRCMTVLDLDGNQLRFLTPRAE